MLTNVKITFTMSADKGVRVVKTGKLLFGSIPTAPQGYVSGIDMTSFAWAVSPSPQKRGAFI